jgi:NADP-dependent 3-hydroxy acid dehydrogenase YdfG
MNPHPQDADASPGARTRTLLITGASSGIGRAIARRCAATHRLVLTARNAEALDLLGDELGAKVVAGDIIDPSTMDRCLQAAGQLHGVVANAGIMPIAPLAQADLQDWHDTIDVNIRGVLNTVHGALSAMPDGGDVVLISSVAGRSAFPSAAVYSASKAAINMLAEGLRSETAAAMKHGGPPLRITTVLPGAVDTSLPDSIRHEDTRIGTKAYYEALPHVLSPDDVARAVAFALEQPEHVAINEIVIRPVGMAR